jgi:hypothetical protein
MGSAPITSAAHKGIEDRRVKLGCVMPGESAAVFGDALRRMASSATYLYQDGPHYWYSIQPTVTKLAEDRAEQLKRDPDKVIAELEHRLKKDLANPGEFARIHPMPHSGADVPDDFDARLVVLGITQPYSKEAGNAAEAAAKIILEHRGNAPRLYRNTLVFLAADKTRLQDLDDAVRKYLAWQSIFRDEAQLGLTSHQKKQVEQQMATADGTVTARLPETYQWLLVPVQNNPQVPITWEAIRLTGADSLAVRASKKLRTDEFLLTAFAATRLRLELDRIPLWRGDHVAIRQLIDDFARYLYLPRLKAPQVLLDAISDGVALLFWEKDSFAFADSFDECSQRYVGLRAGQVVRLNDIESPGVLVKSEIAHHQIDAESKRTESSNTDFPDSKTLVRGNNKTEGNDIPEGSARTTASRPKPKRFHGTSRLDPNRVGHDAGKIAMEVISHLAGLVGSSVTVTIEIEAEIPDGAPDSVVRIVTENARTLKFSNHGFEEE